MNGRPRLHREDPERTEPLRQWSKLYRSPDAANGADPASPPAGGDAWNEVVAEGVAVGYRVVEEQIRQGQRVAEQIGDASYGAAAMGSDLREASERMVRYSADLVALWLDFVNTTFANGDLLRSLSAGWPPPAGAPSAPTPTAAAPSVPIEISSRRPLRVSLELKEGATTRALVVYPLHAVAGGVSPLSDVRLEREGEHGALTLHIGVSDAQPAGTYTGVIVDRATGEPLGTLTARLAE